MWKGIAFAIGVLILYKVLTTIASLRRNIALAKASGIPYFVIPFPYQIPLWLIVKDPIVALVRRLPESWTSPWLDLMDPLQTHFLNYSMFDKLDSDVLLLVSPSLFYLHVADAEFTADVIHRRNDFSKPLELYQTLNLYGKNVVTVEGQPWRQHRRVVAPPFNERNNHLVWSESLLQAQNLMQSVESRDKHKVDMLSQDFMRVALYVISKAGFGRSMVWPGLDGSSDKQDGPHSEREKGRIMTYTESLYNVARSVILLVAFPDPLLRFAPLRLARTAWRAKHEWREYMNDMYTQKKEEQEKQDKESTRSLDLLSGLIRAAGGDDGSEALLSPTEIMGNAFVMIVAGHETTANVLFYAMVFLAMNPQRQWRIQEEIETVFGDRPIDTWSYEQDMPRLFGSMVGATMNETLRLIPPVAFIPKWTETGQTVTLGDRQYHVPPKTLLSIGTFTTHRNPKYWPHGPPHDKEHPEHPLCNHDNDLSEFKPERWLLEGYEGPVVPKGVKGMRGASQGIRTAETDDLHIDTAADTADTLFKPPNGAYMPFSSGARSCLGRRFAQVEFLAVMSAILKNWSIELDPSEWASDEEVERMDDTQKAEIWGKARRAVKDKLYYDMTALITVQLKAGVKVPLRFVKKGNERFASMR